MTCRFKLDENLPADALALLRTAGHDALSVLDQSLGGRPDLEIMDACRGEGRILITFDLDFADIRLYPPDSHNGVWILRGASQSIQNTLALLRGALTLLHTESTNRRLWIVEPERVRIRE